MELTNKIKSLRIERGITQEALAAAVGVSPQAVSKWERGTTTPDVSLLPELAVFFGVSLDELFGLTEEKEEVTATEEKEEVKENTETPKKDIEAKNEKAKDTTKATGTIPYTGGEAIVIAIVAIGLAIGIAYFKNKQYRGI